MCQIEFFEKKRIKSINFHLIFPACHSWYTLTVAIGSEIDLVPGTLFIICDRSVEPHLHRVRYNKPSKKVIKKPSHLAVIPATETGIWGSPACSDNLWNSSIGRINSFSAEA